MKTQRCGAIRHGATCARPKGHTDAHRDASKRGVWPIEWPNAAPEAKVLREAIAELASIAQEIAKGETN